VVLRLVPFLSANPDVSGRLQLSGAAKQGLLRLSAQLIA